MNEKSLPFGQQRKKMVNEQLVARGIRDSQVLLAMSNVSRHLFVPAAVRDEAYSDKPLPLGPNQTISQPYIVAFMLQELNLRRGDKVLEIGTGSGYQAALLSEMGAIVFSMDIDPLLIKNAGLVLKELGYGEVQLKCGDGFEGWRENAPYDAVIVAAAPQEIPRELVKELAPGGRLILPLGSDDKHELILLTSTKAGLSCRELGAVRFVPMQKTSK
jgi:protein-L-isoaspartate(D-aspartate) O-methyltransferase